MNEITLILRNVVFKAATEEETASFKLEAGGDVKVTADPTMLSAIAKFLEEEAVKYED